MRRMLAFVILLATALPWILAGGMVVAWRMDLAHVMEDLCAQRHVPAAVRTCHGDCVLVLRLDKVEREQAPRAEPRFAPHSGPVIAEELAQVRVLDPQGRDIRHSLCMKVLVSRSDPPEPPVPWS
ncbi:MAG: hypothetical protein H6594_12375 [Flavobacteriales bacterium]|nr:hypothetical protein [Flavobacteriales bacterium]